MHIDEFANLIQNDDYINVVNNIAINLINKYKDGDLIDINEYQSKYNWFPMTYDKKKQKYIYNKNKIEKYKHIYNNELSQEGFYIKFYIDAQNKHLVIFSELTNEKLAIFIPEIECLCIEKRKLKEFNNIREKFCSIFHINEESYWETGTYNIKKDLE